MLKTIDKTCKWYLGCPIKFFVDHGELDHKWVKNYCLIGNKNCVKHQLEERGEYHPDNMLPNGVIRKDLSY